MPLASFETAKCRPSGGLNGLIGSLTRGELRGTKPDYSAVLCGVLISPRRCGEAGYRFLLRRLGRSASESTRVVGVRGSCAAMEICMTHVRVSV